jgi:hypothetical protein
MTRKCQSRKKNGKRCGADAQSGKTIRVFHDPVRTSDCERARRTGGLNRARRASVLPAETPDHTLTMPKDVSDLLAQSINQLRRGQLDPKIANAVGYLSTVLLRALEQGPLEERMAKVEVLLGLTRNPHLAEPTVQASKMTSEIEVTHGDDEEKA